MTFQEKSTWIMVVVNAIVYTWYFVSVSRAMAIKPIDEIDYQSTMLAAVIALVVLAVIAIASRGDGDESDERDRSIYRYGEYVAGYVLASGAVMGMGMAMFEVDQFWIANWLLLALVLSQLTSGATRIVLYRRGGVRW